MATRKDVQPLELKVLHTVGCSGTPKTLRLIEEVVEDMGLPIRLEQILVESPEQAVEQRFLGSPTVQVNGLDVDPAARNKTAYGFT